MARYRPYAALAENEEERLQRYRAFLTETVSGEERATILRAVQRGQLTGGKAFVDEIEVRLDRRIELRGPGRPRMTGNRSVPFL